MTESKEAQGAILPDEPSTPPTRPSVRQSLRGYFRGLGAARRGLLLVLFLAVATRLGYAFSRSLVLDEFHSYYHATAANWDAFLEGLYRDNHPPLSFLVIGAAASAFGRAEWALRSPAFLFGLLEIALVASWAGSLVRRSEEEPRGSAWSRAHAPIWAAAMLAASTLHFDYGTQARMYAGLSLCVTIATYAAMTMLVRDDEETGGQPMLGATLAFAFAAAAAFHMHYFAIQYFGVLTGAFVVVALVTGKWVALSMYSIAAFVAFVASLPWAVTGFFHQLRHNLPPGGDDVRFQSLGEAFVQLFFHNIRFGGPIGRIAFIGGAGLVLLIALRGLGLALASKKLRAPVLLMATTAFAVPVLSWAVALYVPRAGFTWHYVLPSAGAMAVLFALGARGRVAGAIAAVPLFLATVLVALHLANPATEDFRGAVAHALEKVKTAPSEEVTRVISVEWQPALFPQGQPWDYYAPRLASGTPPEREPMLEGKFTVQSVERLDDADRVIVICRSMPGNQHLMQVLRKRFPQHTSTPFGFGLDVLVYTR
ncbi:hypothetical protein Poly30_40820 [Planctomycetes bacterium Poly30]|uniref:Glycosyltransferase RgtA/B/C/D-like domain-containing protein n=1 Tax=Saltatorellus ferox TaxID=2528018 RepID=A0A518EWR5_9BACT|nr:hypothetical protein Poly30_40820 [Planctomycetes bacterium Poly30]